MASEEIPAAYGRVISRLARQFEIALSKVELSPAQFRILVQLSDGPEASSSLADKLTLSPPSITTVVDGLVNRHLVDRTHSIDDRRRIALTLTEQGHAVLANAEAAVEERLGDLTAEVDASTARKAYAGLASWWRAMDLHRARRVRERERERMTQSVTL